MIPFLGIFGGIGWPELLVIGVVVLLVFGPRRLPEIAEAFGASIRKFRKATSEVQDEVKREIDSAKEDARPHRDPDDSRTDESRPRKDD